MTQNHEINCYLVKNTFETSKVSLNISCNSCCSCCYSKSNLGCHFLHIFSPERLKPANIWHFCLINELKWLTIQSKHAEDYFSDCFINPDPYCSFPPKSFLSVCLIFENYLVTRECTENTAPYYCTVTVHSLDNEREYPPKTLIHRQTSISTHLSR